MSVLDAAPRWRVSARGLSELPVSAWVALVVVLAFLAAALWPQLLAPRDPFAVDPGAAFQPPSLAHIFGTDESGRDVYTRIVHGAGQSLAIGLGATAIGMLLAMVLGLFAAFGGRFGDFVVGRVLEVLFAFPGLVLALVFIAIVGPGAVPITVAVGLAAAPGYARLVRGQALVVRSSGYMEAARVLGESRISALCRHALPNVVAPIAVIATLGVGQAIVWASSLSYLGLGVSPPAAEWGAMLNSGRTYVATAWWLTVFPGLAIVIAAAATTVLGRAWQARVRQ